MNVLQPSVSAADMAELLSTIASVVQINSYRLETDLTVLSAKSSGDTTVRYTQNRPNKRTKLTSSSYTPPNVGSGTRVTFIVFPDQQNPFSLSNKQVVEAITNKLSEINAACNYLLFYSHTYSQNWKSDWHSVWCEK